MLNTFILVLSMLGSRGIQAPKLQTASFTDAELGGSERIVMSGQPLMVPGTLGKGIRSLQATQFSGVKLNPVEGMIEVWVKPSWAGSDARDHIIWSTNTVNGFQLKLEKSKLGFMRAVSQTPTGMTVSRTDIGSWKPGQWHHVVVGWASHNGNNIGLPLWVDRTAVDGQITKQNLFDPNSTPTELTIEGADFDELIIRPSLSAEGGYGMVASVYRDYFRTAPYTDLKLDNSATGVSSDTRAIVGYPKQFGLSANNQGTWQPTVENVVRYSQWGYFDARKLIRWSSSNPRVLKIDDQGRGFGVSAGTCEVRANFHGLSTTYRVNVISPNRPDLDAIGIELLPRFRSDAASDRPQAGNIVTAKVRVGNFGLVASQLSLVRFSLIKRAAHDFFRVPNTRATSTMEFPLPPLLAGRETSLEFRFPFPADSMWMKVEIDPDNKLDELCVANNTIEELTDSRPIHMGFNPKYFAEERDQKLLNHVGSFSYYDWIRAEKARMDVMLHDAIYPSTGPNGVEEAYRIDRLTPLELGKWDDEPFNKEAVFFDGGYPINEKVDLNSIDCAIIHELGHTVLSQPDLYGYGTAAKNVFVTDDTGKPVAGTPAFPVVSGESNLPSSPGINIPCGLGYPSLMDGCQLWLPSSMAGHIMYYRGYRPDRFWGTQGRMIPSRSNWLLLTDAYDQPLINAAVYVYHVTQAPVQDSGAKYFSDRPKFMGKSDAEGRFIFPNETDQDWDDPKTDVVDGSKPVWNPFGTATTDTAFTPNVWEVEGLLLVRIVAGKQSEYRFVDLTQFNDEFLSGHRVAGRYHLRTSLQPVKEPTQIQRRAIPDAIRTTNKAPVAVAPKDITVQCGDEFTIDGSKSFDPEGQHLIYRWNVGEGWLRGSLSQASKLVLKAPTTPQTLTYKFWVIDGIRCSEPIVVTVKVVRKSA